MPLVHLSLICKKLVAHIKLPDGEPGIIGSLTANVDDKDASADDKAIHDTVLIAAVFCMLNRYVDGLATWTSRDLEFYEAIGTRIATKGYGNRFREAT